MKTSIPIIIAILLSACNSKESKSINTSQSGQNLQSKACACEKPNEKETVIYATNIHLKKEGHNNVLEFHCASVLKGTASVSDVNGNDEHCVAMYDIECVSSANKSLPLSENFKYFTDKMQSQSIFFEDLKSKENYFELSLDPDKKVISISRLNMN